MSVRDTVRKRANGRCEKCGVLFNRNKNKSNASLHHRQPRRLSGYDAVGNLVHICLPCHSAIHLDEESAAKSGWIAWSVPEVIPVMISGRRWAYLLEDGGYEFLTESEAREVIDSQVAEEDVSA